MFGIGMPEMILILAVALIVIGPKKLPDLAKSLGKAMGEFKKATSDLKESMQIDTELEEVKTAFNDIGSEVDKAAKVVPEAADDETPVEKAEPPDVGETEAGDSMDQLKASFDRQNAPASGEDIDRPTDVESSVSDGDQKDTTHKG